MYLLIVFVLNTYSLNLLILIPNLCILWINLDLRILIKSNSVYSSLYLLNINYYFHNFNFEFYVFINCICIECVLFGFPYFNSEFMYFLD
jgi:hypothetical protein